MAILTPYLQARALIPLMMRYRYLVAAPSVTEDASVLGAFGFLINTYTNYGFNIIDQDAVIRRMPAAYGNGLTGIKSLLTMADLRVVVQPRDDIALLRSCGITIENLMVAAARFDDGGDSTNCNDNSENTDSYFLPKPLSRGRSGRNFAICSRGGGINAPGRRFVTRDLDDTDAEDWEIAWEDGQADDTVVGGGVMLAGDKMEQEKNATNRSALHRLSLLQRRLHAPQNMGNIDTTYTVNDELQDDLEPQRQLGGQVDSNSEVDLFAVLNSLA